MSIQKSHYELGAVMLYFKGSGGKEYSVKLKEMKLEVINKPDGWNDRVEDVFKPERFVSGIIHSKPECFEVEELLPPPPVLSLLDRIRAYLIRRIQGDDHSKKSL